MRTVGPLAEIHVFETLPPDILPALYMLAHSTNAVFTSPTVKPGYGVIGLECSGAYNHIFGQLDETRPGFTALNTEVRGEYRVTVQLPPTPDLERRKLYAAAYTVKQNETKRSITLRPGNMAVIALARIAEWRLTPPEPLAEQDLNPTHVMSTLARALGELVQDDEPFRRGYHWYTAADRDSQRRLRFPDWAQF